jgi:hypothetical protein
MTIVEGVNITEAGCPIRDPRFPDAWPTHQAPLNLTIFILYTLYFLSGLIVYYVRRQAPYLKARNFSLVCINAIGGYLLFLSGPLREAIGRDQVSCDFYFMLDALALPMYVAPNCARFFIFYYRARWAEERRKLVNSEDSANVNNKETLKTLQILKRFSSSQFGLIGMAFPFIPVIIWIIIRLVTMPWYLNGCIGCILYSSESRIILIIVAALGAIMFFLAYKIRYLPDPLGILREITLASLIAFLGTLFAVSIDLYNPAELHSSGVLTWSWVTCFGMFISFTLTVIMPVRNSFHIDYTVLRQRANKVETTSIAAKDSQVEEFDSWLIEDEKKDCFTKHLTTEFSPENIKFWDEVTTYRETYEDLSVEENRRKAGYIFRTFIEKGAPLELNIPYSLSQKTKDRFHEVSDNEVYPEDLFDDALNDIYTLMARDSFARFKDSQLYKDFKENRESRKVNVFLGILCNV